MIVKMFWRRLLSICCLVLLSYSIAKMLTIFVLILAGFGGEGYALVFVKYLLGVLLSFLAYILSYLAGGAITGRKEVILVGGGLLVKAFIDISAAGVGVRNIYGESGWGAWYLLLSFLEVFVYVMLAASSNKVFKLLEDVRRRVASISHVARLK